MKFKDWFDDKVIEVEDDNYLENFEEYDYISTSLDAIKKIYNLCKDSIDLIDFIDIIYLKNMQSIFKYVVVFKSKLMIYDNIIDTIRLLNNECILSNMNKDIFMQSLIVNIDNIDIMNEKFYCMISLNPRDIMPDYIIRFEDFMNQFIRQYTDINDLYDNFISQLLMNAEFSGIMQTTLDHVGFVCFKSKENLDKYMNRTREHFKKFIQTESDFSDDAHNIIDLINSVGQSSNLLS